MKAMIFAAGRGDRMRPLTDHTPKPLLTVGGKPLIVWMIENLARAGFNDILINYAWLGEQFPATLGDGSTWGVRLTYSAEDHALETAGGIAKALPWLKENGQDHIFLAVSGDLFTDYDFSHLLPRRETLLAALAAGHLPTMHLLMVPNPDFHEKGDFGLSEDGYLNLNDTPRLTFANIGLYDTRSFSDIIPGTRLALGPIMREHIAKQLATGELFMGRWDNVGNPMQLAALDRQLSI
jgi:N-acetyl-alpha-D-muramate 1-phosphate uridylyltransferase